MNKQGVGTSEKDAETPDSTPLDTLKTEIDRVFNDVSRGWSSMGSWLPTRADFRSALKSFDVSLHVDTTEDEEAYEICVELPGVQEKDVTLSIDGGMMTIRGEKKSEREEKKKEFHLTERRFGSFERSFSVPDDVDEAKITAAYDNGVLTVVLPKSAESKTSGRRIQIKSKGK